MNTIIQAKQTRYNQPGQERHIYVEATVCETVKAIGAGQITTEHVLWVINSQLTEAYHFTKQQVRRELNALAKYDLRYSPLRKGRMVRNSTDRYRWIV